MTKEYMPKDDVTLLEKRLDEIKHGAQTDADHNLESGYYWIVRALCEIALEIRTLAIVIAKK